MTDWSISTVPTATKPAAAPRQAQQKTPQEAIDEFWSRFTSKFPGNITTIVPPSRHVDGVARTGAKGSSTQASYKDAAAMCRAKVESIVKECRRINKKYRDPHFDLESDLKLGRRDCLESLSNLAIPDLAEKMITVPGSKFKPQSTKRVSDVFDKPQFFIDGPTAKDVKQGSDGDCWLMAALCTLSNKEGLIEKLCVAHDQDVGVYGFVFYRDGEWISEIIDDFLYLTKPDYEEGYAERILLDDLERVNPEEAYRRIYQSNSTALYFAQCQHPQETWLPLLEKCYAKAHGDYAAIDGGFGGEGVEDLTGGVASEVYTTDILDKEYFWKEELLKVNEDFLFGCSTGVWGTNFGERKGIVDLHAYSIQKAVEIDGKRLVRLKNPWGRGEWKGPWSDGSQEWTSEWLAKLDHTFGNDGDFWITYEDLLRKYQAFERTRLFGDDDWRVAQIWATLVVPWALDYHDTYFSFTISKPGPVVLVLAQLDDRYFRGLEGQYRFELAFRLHKAGQEGYLVRSEAPYRMRRSVNVELELEDAGEYEVRMRVSAIRLESYLPIEEVVRSNAKLCREKLTRIGLAYNLAHGKGKTTETADEKAVREAYEKKAKDKERREIKDRILSNREEAHYLTTKRLQRDQKKRWRDTQKRKTKASGQEAESTKPNPDPANETERPNHSHLASHKTKQTNGSNGSGVGRSRENGARDTDTHTNTMAPGDPEETLEETEQGNRLGGDRRGTNSPTSEQSKVLTEANLTRIDPAAEYESNTQHFDTLESEDAFSDLGSLSELSERELDIQIDSYTRKPLALAAEAAELPMGQAEPDEFEKDPWNAVAVIGLRVYYKIAEQDKDAEIVKLRVVRPSLYLDEDDGEMKLVDKDPKSKGLDMDDPLKTQ